MPSKRRQGNDGTNDDQDHNSHSSDHTDQPPKKRLSKRQQAQAKNEASTKIDASAVTPTSGNKPLPKKKGKPPDPNSMRQLQLKAKEDRKTRVEAEEKATELQQKLDTIHEKQLASADQGKDYIQDDRAIRENVEILFKMIADWTTEWAHNDIITKHLSEMEVSDLIVYLTGQIDGSKLGILEVPDSVQEKFLWYPAGCQRITEAIISWWVARKLLQKPFHFLGPSSGPSDFVKEADLQTLRNSMKGSRFDKKVWYSRTLRSCYKSVQYGGSFQDPMSNDTFEQERQTSYKQWAEDYLDATNRTFYPLLRDCEAEESEYRFNELLKIFCIAGKLSLQLWLQDSEIMVMRRPSVGEDLIAATSEGRCVSRIPLNLELGPDPASQVQADVWVRLGLSLIRYEINGASTELLICPPMFLSISDEKWKRKKQRYHGSQQIVEIREIGAPDVSFSEKHAAMENETLFNESQCAQELLPDIDRPNDQVKAQVVAETDQQIQIYTSPSTSTKKPSRMLTFSGDHEPGGPRSQATDPLRESQTQRPNSQGIRSECSQQGPVEDESAAPDTNHAGSSVSGFDAASSDRNPGGTREAAPDRLQRQRAATILSEDEKWHEGRMGSIDESKRGQILVKSGPEPSQEWHESESGSLGAGLSAPSALIDLTADDENESEIRQKSI